MYCMYICLMYVCVLTIGSDSLHCECGVPSGGAGVRCLHQRRYEGHGQDRKRIHRHAEVSGDVSNRKSADFERKKQRSWKGLGKGM